MARSSSPAGTAPPRPRAPDAEAPLAGFQAGYAFDAAGTGLGPAVQTLTEHLRALGAEVSGADDVPGGDRFLMDVSGPGCRMDLSLQGWRRPAAVRFAENLAQADCGIMAVHGRAEADPRPLGVPHVGVLAGVAAVTGLLAAVLAHRRGVPVGRVELDADRVALVAVSQYIAAATASEDPDLGAAPSRDRPPFTSTDGVAFELEVFDAERWGLFWSGLAAPDAAVGRGWRPFLLRYENASLALPPGLHEAARARRFDEIRDLAARTGVSVVPVRSVAQRRADPDIGVPPWEFRPAGVLDATTAGLHAALPSHAALSPADGGLPLAGLHVVESTRRVQGPMATRLLHLLGATVTRIEPPGGDPMRGIPPMAGDCSAKFRALNEGKRIAEVDLKSRAGRAEVMDLVRDADVFLHNWAPGKDAEMGLDADALHAANPRLVYATASGWGGVLGTAPPAGTDYTVQAYSGLAAAIGGPAGPPRPSLMILVDVLGGFVSAEGVLAALVKRHRDGGCRVETSLLAAATTLLAGRLRDRPAAAAPGTGPATVVDAVFPTADGLLSVVACDTEAGAFAEALGVRAADLLRPDESAVVLGAALTARPAQEWVRRLRDAGVPAAVVRADLSTLPSCDRYADAFEQHDCAVATSPWQFS